MTSVSHGDEYVAVRGARWFTVAFVTVGALNYLYALVLTRLLNVRQYAVFGAGQGLLLWAGTVATVSVPWVLAQSLARARPDSGGFLASRFAIMAGAGIGLAAGAVIGLVGGQFADPLAALVLAASAFVIFLGTPSQGWLQGSGRLRILSSLTVGESVVRNLAGLLLVTVGGLGATGALAATGIGGLLLLPWWPRVPWAPARAWRAALASRTIWHRTLGIAAVQGLVTLLVSIDLVVVTLLPASRDLVASYQASAAVSRVPVFVASAVCTAFFPALSRRARGGDLAARAIAMYATVTLPLVAVLLTVPPAVLGVAFPPQYTAMSTLLRFTAVTGLAAGGVNLVTTFFQAVNDYSCLWWQLPGLAGYLAALLAGWWAAGVTGLAAGAALGAAAALALVGYHFVRRQGRGLLRQVSLLEPAAAAVILVAVRWFPVVWTAAACLIGLRAGVRFLRSARARRESGPGEEGPGTGARP